MRCRLFIVLLLSSCAISQTPDPTRVDGRISGTVVNEDGKPVPEATVYVSEEASSIVDANSVVAYTDFGGRFDFGRKLKHGVYEIYASQNMKASVCLRFRQRYAFHLVWSGSRNGAYQFLTRSV